RSAPLVARPSPCLFILVTRPATTASHSLSLHDALPIWPTGAHDSVSSLLDRRLKPDGVWVDCKPISRHLACFRGAVRLLRGHPSDRKSTRLNSSHVKISYAVFCLKKKTTHTRQTSRHKP